MRVKFVRCRMCRTRFPEALLVLRDGRLLISIEHARHYADTHGIPNDVLIELVETAIDRVLVFGHEPFDVTVKP